MVSDPAYSLRERLVGCKKLFKMGVEPPEWCFSREALGRAYVLTQNSRAAPPVSLLGNPASATPSAKTTGNPDLDALAGGRSKRRRHPKKTMKKNRKRMTRKK
jgi:hypothetical protein